MNAHRLPLALIAALGAACASPTGLGADAVPAACVEARDHILACTGRELTLDGCDEETAAVALASSCDELAEADGKADCSVWAPWACWGWGGGGRDEEPTTASLFVRVEQCVSLHGCGLSAPCTQVEVRDAADTVVATGVTNGSGGLRVDDLSPDATYTVRVLRTDGSTAALAYEPFEHERGPAVRTVAVEAGDDNRLFFGLDDGESERTRACASSVAIPVHVYEDGAPADGEETEWDWIVEVVTPDGDVDLTRAYRFYGETENAVRLRNVAAGTVALTFHRVSIPAEPQCSWYYIGSELRFGGVGSWRDDECRLPNRNELLLEHFAVEDVAPVTYEVTVPAGAEAVRLDPIVIDDPVPGL